MPPLRSLDCFIVYYLNVFRERRNIILSEDQNSPVAAFSFVTDLTQAMEGIMQMWIGCERLRNEWIHRVTVLRDREPTIVDPREALRRMVGDREVPDCIDMAVTLIGKQCLREGIVNHWSLDGDL
jgi:hypothetical protein